MAPPISSNATLHALTERLASHSRTLQPFFNGAGLPPGIDPSAFSARGYRQPTAPPQLPVLQLVGRHQDPPPVPIVPDQNGKIPDNTSSESEVPVSRVTCPAGNRWPEWGVHSDTRCFRCEEDELDAFIADMAMVLRREYDSWVEQCWTEAFHYMFHHTIPSLIIHLILTGADPVFLRRSVVHGGPSLDHMFQTSMLEVLYQELELRLSGTRPSEAGPSKPPPTADPNAPLPTFPRDGVCFHDLAVSHGMPLDDDEHGLCLCQLSTCLGCFHAVSSTRRGPISLLPYELAQTSVREGWTGGVESEEQAQGRRQSMRTNVTKKEMLPSGQGFVRNPKLTTNGVAHPRPAPMFPHPQMTDVLAVEEHMRWRLKEMGASDPAVESRYGPCTNSPVALEGIDQHEDNSEDGDGKGGKAGTKVVKVTRGKGKVRRVVNGGPKKDGKGKQVYLPREWTEADPQERNMAIVLTFRHFVKLLYQATMACSPFNYPGYARDLDELYRIHPIAMYRRLAEPSVARRKNSRETRAWQDCMDKWAEELGIREKTQGNMLVNEGRHAEAVEYYTRAISLDGKKTVYYSNRAVALNSLGMHERAEWDCKHILSKDSKNGKAFYQRAVARRGMDKWREAEADLREVLRYQPGNESAKKLMMLVKGEVGKLPKQRVEDVMDF